MISTILQYSTTEIIFLETNLKQCDKFSDEIIIPICSHFFNGQPEDVNLLKETTSIVKKYSKAKIIMFDWEGTQSNNSYYHNLSRKIGTDAAKNNWLFFLDADEIVSDEFYDWFQSVCNLDRAWWLSCYWYFREPIYQAVANEGAGLLIPKKYCSWDLYNKLERGQLFQKMHDANKLSLSDFEEILSLSGKKMVHHYSWVRNKNDMINKIKNWGHKDDKNWETLINEELSRPFNGTDFIHNYQYNIVDNYFNIKLNFNKIDQLLIDYILDPENPDHNYNLGLYYESIDQTASALSYFLRCAERSKVLEMTYECLIRSSDCFEKQGKRNFTVKNLLQHAISMCPTRPEAYYLLSKFYEKQNIDGSWQDSYMIASIGEKISDFNSVKLMNPVDFPGKYALLFQKGVAAWWCGLVEESKDIFISLLHNEKNIDFTFIQPCLNNLSIMQTKPFINYDKNKDKLKINFTESKNIHENYSEAFQDLFVLTVLNGKNNGTYLEIGAGDPIYGNNSYLLEQNFYWKGVSLDIDENIVQTYNKIRSNKCFCKDATCIDYDKFLSGLNYPKNIDYLQIDCDPPQVSYQILLNLPLDIYKFAVITYEHDNYCDDSKSFQIKSSKFLENYGYIKILSNISPDNHRNYEDWWIHPDLVNKEHYQALINLDNTIKNSQYIFLEK